MTDTITTTTTAEKALATHCTLRQGRWRGDVHPGRRSLKWAAAASVDCLITREEAIADFINDLDAAHRNAAQEESQQANERTANRLG